MITGGTAKFSLVLSSSRQPSLHLPQACLSPMEFLQNQSSLAPVSYSFNEADSSLMQEYWSAPLCSKGNLHRVDTTLQLPERKIVKMISGDYAVTVAQLIKQVLQHQTTRVRGPTMPLYSIKKRGHK